MKKKVPEKCLFLAIFALILITPIAAVSASTEGNLLITHLSGTNISYTYDQLLAMPMTNTSATLYCYGNIVTGGNWGGVSLGYLLQQAGTEPAFASIDFLATDGYRVSIPLSLAMQAQVIIAYQKDDLPLSEGLRLVLPGENGNLWIKSISTIAMNTVEVSIQQVDIAQPALMGILSSFNLNEPSSPLQQEPIQPHPTAMPKNETSTKTIAPPANITQLPPTTSIPKNSNPEALDSSFSIVIACGIGFGTIVALLAVAYVTQRTNARIQR